MKRLALAFCTMAIGLFFGCGAATAAANVVGDWHGRLDFGASGALRIDVTVTGHAGTLSGTLTSPDQSPTPIPLDTVTQSGSEIGFTCNAIGVTFKGTEQDDGKAIKGTFMQRGMSFPLTLHRGSDTVQMGTSLTKAQAAKLAGTWEGELNAGVSLRLVLHITRGENGRYVSTLDSPDQGAAGIPSTFTVNGDTIDVKLPSVGASYHATLDAAHSQMSGTFTQLGRDLPLTVRKVDHVSSRPRPQTPKPPFPYRTEGVAFPGGANGVTLAGTITEPDGDGPFPAVVLVSGSGPNDRDETILGHRPFLVIADCLTRRGFAVLRFDKRGTHQSTGDYADATTDDFAADALAAVAFAKTRKEIDPKRIGLLGHSEGGLIAPICAAKSTDVAFLVLMAAPGVRGDDVLTWQIAAVGKAAGESPREIEQGQALVREAVRIYSTCSDRSSIEAKLRAYARKEIPAKSKRGKGQSEDASVASILSHQFDAAVSQLALPWFRRFLTYDPAPTLRQVHCSVLALAGSLDKQVNPEENLSAIATALKEAGNPDFTVALMPGLNHLFQPAKTGGVDEYARVETTIDPSVLAKIGGWLDVHTKSVGR